MNTRAARRAQVRASRKRSSLETPPALEESHLNGVRAAREGSDMNISHIAGIALASTLLPVTATSADIPASDTIIVTATRNEIPLEDALVPVRVITREDIELSMATDLAELLRFEAGIEIGRNGGPGQATSLFLKGTDSNHTLVLVDGVRINPGTIGGAAVQHIVPEIIERVEIVKGARSSLYGSDAIGGVINIITRDAEESYFEAAAGGGSFDTRTAHLSGGVSGERVEFGATLGWQDTDGYAPRVDSPLERGYDNLSFSAFALAALGSGEIGLRHWQAAGNVEYLDFFLAPVDQDYENSATALQLDTPLGARGSSKLILSHMRDEIRQRQTPDYVLSERVTLDWQYTHPLADHTLAAGIYYFDENAESLSFGSGFDADTEVRALFVQDQYVAGRHRAFVALRHSDHETFGGQTTWNAEYGFDLTPDWRISAGLGRAFRAPDATDRFGFGGNPALEPETADSARLGLRYAFGARHRFDVELYANDLDNLIEFDLQSFTLVNVDRAEIRGVELAYEYGGDTWDLSAALVRQRADNAITGARLLRRAEQSASLTIARALGAHRVGLSLLASGDREDFGGVELDSYVVASLSAQFRLGPGLRLVARIENLADEDYRTAADYRMQERSGFVELKYTWR